MDPQDQTSLGFEVDADCLSAVQAAEASDDGECSQDSGSSKSPSKRSGKKKNKVKKNGKGKAKAKAKAKKAPKKGVSSDPTVNQGWAK